MKISRPNIIVALDSDNIESVREKLHQLSPDQCGIKLGKTLFTRYGSSVVKEVIEAGFKVFLDLKFHDIPKQVAGAVKAAGELGVWMLTLHVSGGEDMLIAARESIAHLPKESRPILVGVTILTSLNDSDVKRIGFEKKIDELVPNLAIFAESTGLDGIVCSPLEIQSVRSVVAPNFLIVTPGIRLAANEKQDQKRVMTPQDAIAAGADCLVIGRSITLADDPSKALAKCGVF